MRSSGFLNSIRKWLDGEDAVELAPETATVKTEWDDFFVLIAREVEAVMKREMFTPPGGTTYLPAEYIVYLSREDDLQWQGRKREGLAEGLRNILEKRARDLVGDKPLKSQRIAITLGADGTLEKGKVRVQEIWDDESPRTEVGTRTRREGARAALGGGAVEAVGEDERTMILSRVRRFSIEYRLGSGEPKVFTAQRQRIEIGRGSKDFVIDLKLEGDQEISRRQAVLERLGAGRFQLECLGRNPIEVDGRELQPGEKVEFETGRSIRIGLYQLQVNDGPVEAGKESE
jgi:hypothetical protein